MVESILKIYCDGGSRSNPGPAAAAYVIVDGVSIVSKGSKYLGKTTNNVAEYEAVILALQTLIKERLFRGISRVEFYLDSELVTKQLNGDYKVKNNTLRKLNAKIVDLLQLFDSQVTFNYIRREKNSMADFLVNKELDKNMNSS